MKEYQEPQIEVVEFEVEDIVTDQIGNEFDSTNLGEWDE
jgi:hypothetical protein